MVLEHKNPYGLTYKQDLVIEEMVEQAKRGEGVKATDAHEKIYSVCSRDSASAAANANLKKRYFREALVSRMYERNVIGPGGKLENRLVEGLDATKQGSGGNKRVDYNARLRYIKEINKIIGAYAPKKVDRRSLNLDVELKGDKLDEKIKNLQQELD